MLERDISKEFKEMDNTSFEDFLFDLSLETKDKILLTINTNDISSAKRLKAIKEYSEDSLEFNIAITAIVEDYRKELNVFASWIKWVEKK